jgi:general stress protein 26
MDERPEWPKGGPYRDSPADGSRAYSLPVSPEGASFAELEEDFLRIVRETVFCTVTTVGEDGRPRNRMLHPVFLVRDGRPMGWALTGRTPLKTRHLAANPHVACSYWNPSHDTLFVDCVASWVEDDQEKADVWDVFLETPQPLGWGAEGLAGYGPDEWRNPIFTPLRLDPWRVQLMRGEEYPLGNLTGIVWYGP